MISSLETCNFTQLGTNGHVEYSWSNDIREKIFQFQLQLTRTNKEGLIYLEERAMEILTQLTIYYYQSQYKLDSRYEKEILTYYLTLFYKIIGNTRDIEDGKGEYTLSYMLLYVWYNFYPELSLFALKCFVTMSDGDETRPYGSWKDIKYFCHYLHITKNVPLDHTLIRYAIMLMNSQLQKDYIQFLSNETTVKLSISLVSKWVPREKSKKFGWLYKELACHYFPYTKTAKEATRHKAVLKSMIGYRKIITTLNLILDTLQIKQCNNGWAEIDFTRVTSISLVKQSSALSNISYCGDEKTDLEERKLCREHFETYIQKRLEPNIKINKHREQVGVVDLVKQAMEINLLSLKEKENSQNIQIKKDLLNMLWKETDNPFCKMIPIVDVSSYKDDSYYAAIGIGLKIVEKSLIGKRMMVFGGFPNWISLEDSSNFTDMVQKVQEIESGLNPNLYSALEQMIDTIVEAKLSEENIKSMTIVILSNWDIERWNKENNDTVYENIKQLFEKVHCTPRILLWNLKSGSGFPCLSLFPSVAMVSGYNNKLLNLFCRDETKAIKQYIPWNFFLKSLENKRYESLEKRIQQFFTSYTF